MYKQVKINESGKRKPLIYWLYLKVRGSVQTEDGLGIANIFYLLFSHFLKSLSLPNIYSIFIYFAC